jgi:hypothetical protein
VDNTVGNENIGGDDTRAVDEDTTAVDSDGQILAVQSLEHSSIGQTGAVTGSRSHNRMVGENIGDLLRSKVGKTAANGLECGVVWRKDGDVGRGINGVQEVGGVEGTTERAQTSSGESVRSAQRQSKNSVDDVDDTTSEVHILRMLTVNSRGPRMGTYGLGDGRVHLQSAVESNVAVAQLRPNPLTPSDLFIKVSVTHKDLIVFVKLTFVYEVLVNRVGTNALVLVTCDPYTVPLRTWY